MKLLASRRNASLHRSDPLHSSICLFTSNALERSGCADAKGCAAVDLQAKMDLSAENPFGDLMNKAVKLKGAQQAQLRILFDSWPQYFQHSMFMQESVLSVRELAFPERIEAAEAMKTKGNEHYSNSAFDEAVAEYEKALAVFKYIENRDPGWKKKGIEDTDLRVIDHKCVDEEDQKRLDALKLSCYLNIAGGFAVSILRRKTLTSY